MATKHFRRSRKDYPQGVIGIYDNGGKTIDRYTVVFEPYEVLGKITEEYARWRFPILAMNCAPFRPQGFGQHDSLNFRYTRQKGERTINFADLPADCQRCVMQDLQEEH